MMTDLQVKAERAVLTSALVTVWGTLVAAQGAALMLYPLYRMVIDRREPHPASPLAESS